jgi:mannitol-1-phosphate/altronate dehydrogenase
VITEPFSQWVVEDSFCHVRPPLDRVGVQFVDDVTPHALMKTRLLNASHCAIGFLGSLAGLQRADHVMRDSILGGYVERLMSREVAPLLPNVPGVDLGRYVDTLLERLSNPKIGDDLERLCRAGSTKLPAHVLPSIVGARERGRDHRLLTLAVAGWLLHLRGVDERGRRLACDDPLGTRLRAATARGRGDPRPVLAEIPAFGALAADAQFVCALESSIRTLDRIGVRAAVADCLAEASIAA